MPLLLSDEEVQELLTIDMCLESLEPAYRELGSGWSETSPRCDIITANPQSNNQESFHGLKSMMGTVSGFEVGAIRINSDVITWQSTDQGLKRVKVPKAPGQRYVGLVLLFSLKTGELLSIFPDASIQRMRVAATSALGAKYLARDDAKSLGIYGSGWQAGAHLMCISKIRKLKEARVQSPNWERCKSFCREMSNELEMEVVPVKDPQEIMQASDIVAACTNSLAHVIFGKWVREGMHLSCVKPGELDQETYDRCDIIVLHTRQLAPFDYFVNGGRDIPHGLVKERESYLPGNFKGIEWEKLPLLSDLILGKGPKRESDSQVTCFCNNLGLGMQFAAVGQAIYSKAIGEGKGKELPSEWFSQINHP